MKTITVYTIKQFINAVETALPGDCMILDECVETSGILQGQTIQQHVNNISIMARSRGIIVKINEKNKHVHPLIKKHFDDFFEWWSQYTNVIDARSRSVLYKLIHESNNINRIRHDKELFIEAQLYILLTEIRPRIKHSSTNNPFQQAIIYKRLNDCISRILEKQGEIKND